MGAKRYPHTDKDFGFIFAGTFCTHLLIRFTWTTHTHTHIGRLSSHNRGNNEK